MKFRKGDLVSFLNDTGGGTVSRVDEKGFVYVVTPDGFEIPVSEKELVFKGTFNISDREKEPEAVHIQRTVSFERTKPKPRETITLPKNIAVDVHLNLLLGFIPENDGPVFNNTIGCYLINDSPYYIYYLAGKKESGSLQHIASGIIESETKTFLLSLDQTSLSKISDFHIQILFVTGGRYYRRKPVDVMVSLNLVNFSKESYYRENDYFNEKAVIFDIIGKPEILTDLDIPDEIKELKMQADKISKPKQKEPVSDTFVVDIHYEGEGMVNSQLSPSAILALQMSRFHSAVEEAISKNMRRLVIIHGIGQGTLKMQI
ncbi:MAG TPA: DUF2027 domain-containing protein, partial [Bacteroidales bacterium]|nr:DUF2027 domain-containing protein [Bacteroidales bacterium]